MSCRMYSKGQSGLGAHGALIPHFPESLTRKLYRKKVHGNDPQCAPCAPAIPAVTRTHNGQDDEQETITGKFQ
jgi:hypothetical protein